MWPTTTLNLPRTPVTPPSTARSQHAGTVIGKSNLATRPELEVPCGGAKEKMPHAIEMRPPPEMRTACCCAAVVTLRKGLWPALCLTETETMPSLSMAVNFSMRPAMNTHHGYPCPIPPFDQSTASAPTSHNLAHSLETSVMSNMPPGPCAATSSSCCGPSAFNSKHVSAESLSES